jgi:tRNA nucleotidyltransferase/poly(A) polymerase
MPREQEIPAIRKSRASLCPLLKKAHNSCMTPRDLADRICATLRQNGHQAYLVGGCVRDLLLGRDPSDYDISTGARPEQVRELFPRSLTVGAKFGVILVVEDGAEVEVATFRSDVGYSDGRHPDNVVYSESAKEDVRRRDFTINGLLMDPATREVLDVVDGRADLRAGIVRAIGDPRGRFAEDKLRMMRAVRFAARFGFRIERETLAAAQALAPQVTQVSPERLREELTKLLTEGAARPGFELLDETGLLAVVLPDVARMKGVEQPPQFHPEGDVWIHTRMMLRQPRGPAHGSASMDMSKPAHGWRRGSAANSVSRMTTPSKSKRWSRIIFVLKMSGKCGRRRSSGLCACPGLKNTWNCTDWIVFQVTAA